MATLGMMRFTVWNSTLRRIVMWNVMSMLSSSQHDCRFRFRRDVTLRMSHSTLGFMCFVSMP